MLAALVQAVPTCPWSRFDPPTMKFCEENLCAWITQPANTWSNLAYVLVGLYVWRQGRDAPGLARLFGAIALAVGVTSFAYHASFTFVFQVADLASMFLLSSTLVVLNLRREGFGGTRRLFAVFAGLNVAALALLLALRRVGILLFAAQLLLALGLEAHLRLSARARAEATRQDRYLGFSLLLFAAAYAFWLLDFLRLACDPGQHVLQGHAAWHIINAGCFALLFRYYRSIEAPAELQPAPLPSI